jgi:UDP-N-acetylglucosamine 2-epimerase (non-hydrolysing)
MPATVMLVGGARPNFMKLAPLWSALKPDPDFEPLLVHTGQHYDDALSGSFLRDLGLPEPSHSLEVGSGSHATQTARIMERMEPVLIAERPAAVIVVGDVNSTLAAALVATKLGIAVVHVEAGLRSFDRTMPEEINRLAVDAISDLMLVSERSGERNLLREGVSRERIRFTGNLMIDSLELHLPAAVSRSIPDRLGIVGEYGVVTLHRPANVDDQAQLEALMGALGIIARRLPLYFPVHPRTRARITAAGMTVSDRIHLLEPLSYLDFLGLVNGSSAVFTDSGGIQEETTVLGITCLTLRDNTERPATVEEGTNRLAGTRPESILAAWNEVAMEGLHRRPRRVPQGWDGQAAGRCREALREFLKLRTLAGSLS